MNFDTLAEGERPRPRSKRPFGDVSDPDTEAAARAFGSGAKIVILSGAHLSRNPRVHKEARALGLAGYDVEVLGAWFDRSLAAQDVAILAAAPFRFTPVVDLTHRRLPDRAFDRGRQWFQKFIPSDSPRRLGRVAIGLSRAALMRRADLFIAHLEAGLAAGSELLTAGRPVMVDMEDWYSEDLLPEARSARPIAMLKRLEGSLLNRAVYASCPSDAMGRGLVEVYGCPPPATLYNAFAWRDRDTIMPGHKDRRDPCRPSLHWVSQTLGWGRGLEDLIDALPLIRSDIEVHLRGVPVPAFKSYIVERLPEPWRDRVFFHDLVGNVELNSRIAEHDIGFAGEMKYCKSRDLTVTNKILHYLLCGLSVIASDTAGQVEVAQKAGPAVTLYPSGNAVELAAAVDRLAGNPALLAQSKAAALRSAETVFCWERQEPLLLNAVETALRVS